VEWKIEEGCSKRPGRALLATGTGPMLAGPPPKLDFLPNMLELKDVCFYVIRAKMCF
jgi:hypothetical protein